MNLLRLTSVVRNGDDFVGVWDTVSSVGWKNNPLKLPFSADNPDINIGRHAIAIDEKACVLPDEPLDAVRRS